MEITPIIHKSINLKNLRDLLKMYPYLINNLKWEKTFSTFDFNSINTNFEGYKESIYKFACQLGIENRGNKYFEVNEFLFLLSDKQLLNYIRFWILTYYVPNPYVISEGNPKIIWIDICENILKSERLEIDYYKYFHDNINKKIKVSRPDNFANSRTLLKAILEYGIFIELKNDKRTIFIKKEEKELVRKTVDYIKKYFEIPKRHKNKNEFFKRYSIDNFQKMFPISIRKKNYKDIEVNMDREIKIDNLIFENREEIKRRVNKALKSGKNIILAGVPGSGKSKLAKDICESFEVEYKMTTAISDWTTYETMGSYKVDSKSNLYFDEGIFLSCFKDERNEVKNEWLIVDEMNRADIDKAFGVFFSVLSGDDIDLSFKNEYRENIEIISEENITDPRDIKSNQYLIPKDWRMIGTINTLDKNTLYEMSYAFMRRFAIIPIEVPSNITKELIREYFSIWNIKEETIGNINNVDAIYNLWLGINDYREIGPAIIKDIVSYVEEEEDWTSAIILYVLPQFEGVNEDILNGFIDKLEEINKLGVKINIDKLKKYIEDFFSLDLY